MNAAEIQFWQSQADAGRLLLAVQAQRSRAVRFFGESAVRMGDEARLYRILEAYGIVEASDNELLEDMNVVPKWVVKQLRDSPEFEHKEMVVKAVREFTLADVRRLKARAKQLLEEIFDNNS